tara:strand:+ start:879 stop:1259 length:381 start_codon:yes stop_codon:yes gene_type:complete
MALPGAVLATDLSDINESDSFNVSEILTVGEGDEAQDRSYFDENKDEAPIVLFILDIINFITRIVGAIAMLLIIIGGLMMIVAQGEEHLLQKGKDTLIAAVFGLIIVMFSYIVVRFVQSLFYLQGV